MPDMTAIDDASSIVRDAVRAAQNRMAMLHALAELDLPDAWIAAGAVRNAVWDARHGYHRSTPLTDVDVIWFDPARPQREFDVALEQRVSRRLQGVTWSVKNQARMHARNNDAPYCDCLDAMRAWPETATGIAARLDPGGDIELASAFGLDDLVGLLLRPTPRFAGESAFHARLTAKRWLETWPLLRVVEART
jgi:hypothetical protein